MAPSSHATPLLGSGAASSSSEPIHALDAATGQHGMPMGQQGIPPSRHAIPMQAMDVPVGTPVAQAMPQLPAAASLKDQYSGYQFTPEADDDGLYRRGVAEAEMLEPDAATPLQLFVRPVVVSTECMLHQVLGEIGPVDLGMEVPSAASLLSSEEEGGNDSEDLSMTASSLPAQIRSALA